MIVVAQIFAMLFFFTVSCVVLPASAYTWHLIVYSVSFSALIQISTELAVKMLGIRRC